MMTVAVQETAFPVATSAGGGAPARRAVVRWSWRMFQREWRQQGLVLTLLIVAVAALTIGLAVVWNVAELGADPTFGTANSIISVNGSDPNLASDIRMIQSRVGPSDVIEHQTVPVPGSVAALDLRAQNPNGTFGHVMLRLDSGQYPNGPGEVAVTTGVAQTFGLHVGSTWQVDERTFKVVGMVENPLNLLDQFALIAPGQIAQPTTVDILSNASQLNGQQLGLSDGALQGFDSRGAGSKAQVEAVVLALGSLLLVFVGLMAVAGFAVMAQRRMRALGMLGALGATDRHLRAAMLANGAAVGGTAAVAGTLLGLLGWFAFAPTLQSSVQHRIDRLALPWIYLVIGMALTFITAVLAAWWPARSVARIPVVAALSGRPPRPQPAHRFATMGAALLSTGLLLLAFADQRRAGFTIGGTVMTALGLLFLAPLAIRLLAAAAWRAPISARLALRDLVRYQARSGAALGAVTLAIGISATIAISASAAETPTSAGNLPANQLILYLSAPESGNPVPPLTGTQLQTLSQNVTQMAASIRAAHMLTLEQAYDPRTPLQPAQPGLGGGQNAGYGTLTLAQITRTGRGEEISTIVPLYVATPEILAYYGISASQIDPSADVITSRKDLNGLKFFDPSFGRERDQTTPLPTIQILPHLSIFTSAPGALITSHGMASLGLQPLTAAWLIQTRNPLTGAQVNILRNAAAQAGLQLERRKTQTNLAALRSWSTAAGIVLALGVLGMTVGLIRSETANDLRTLTATGAGSRTRRGLTGATAGSIALLGAISGTAGAYAALLTWHHSDLSPLGRVPTTSLLLILLGLPVIAAAAGWLLAGRDVPAISRRPLE
jgi:putative ABC transport system permease protein